MRMTDMFTRTRQKNKISPQWNRNQWFLVVSIMVEANGHLTFVRISNFWIHRFPHPHVLLSIQILLKTVQKLKFCIYDTGAIHKLCYLWLKWTNTIAYDSSHKYKHCSMLLTMICECKYNYICFRSSWHLWYGICWW